jgi:hypothetical protein
MLRLADARPAKNSFSLCCPPGADGGAEDGADEQPIDNQPAPTSATNASQYLIELLPGAESDVNPALARMDTASTVSVGAARGENKVQEQSVQIAGRIQHNFMCASPGLVSQQYILHAPPSDLL